MKKLIIIDSHSIIHRAYHAYPTTLSLPDGRLTNAIYGFTSILMKVLIDLKPDNVVAVFDSPKRGVRSEIYSQYKANRKPMENDLIEQIPSIRKVIKAFAIPLIEVDSFEADDVIGTICSKKKFKEFEKIIVTGDQDLFQLINVNTSVFLAGKNFKDSKIYRADDVFNKLGIYPEDITNFKGIRGDPSDNIPGIKGIGEKGAVELISKYKNLEGIYKHIDEIKPAIKKKLIESKETAFLSRNLAEVLKNVPLKINIEQTKFPQFSEKDLFMVFSEFRFNSLLTKIKKLKSESVTELDLNSKDVAINMFENNKFKMKVHDAEEFDKLSLFKNDKVFIHSIEGFEKIAIIYNDFLFKFSIKTDKNTLKKVFQKVKNAVIVTFDFKNLLKLLSKVNIELKNDFFDLALACSLLLNGKSKIALENLNQSLLGNNFQIFIDDEEKILIEVQIIKELYKKLWPKFIGQNKEEGLANLYEKVEKPLVRILFEMENRGICINLDKLNKLDFELSNKVKLVKKEIFDAVGHEFNLNSPKEVSSLLFKELELPVFEKTKHGATSTGYAVLKKLKGLHPVIEKMIEYRELSKLLSTYIKPYYEHGKSGKIHTTFNQFEVLSGRLSSKNPNIQNLPASGEWGKKIKQLFCANKKMKFVAFDYSQIELRLLAHFSHDKKLLEAFRKNIDIHKLTASSMYSKPIDEISDEERGKAKTVNFSIIFGMNARSLSELLNVSFKEANEFLNKYFLLYPGVKSYFENSRKKLFQDGFLETLLKRKRFIGQNVVLNKFYQNAVVREMLNFPLQGTEADILKLAMIKSFEHISKNYKNKVFLVHSIHDELIFEVSNYIQMEKFICEIKNIIENVVKLDVPLRVEVAIGLNLGELEPF